MANEITIIMDNGGGCTLQCNGYQHYYNDMAQAAHDALKAINDGTDGWDGDESEDGMLEPTDEQRSNGGYVVYTTSDLDATAAEMVGSSWANEAAFADSYHLAR